MKTLSERDLEGLVIDHPPPLLPHRYSVQAAGADPTSPLVTIYRRRAVNAAAWIAEAAGQQRFNYYLLRSGRHNWDLYDDVGGHTGSCDSLPDSEAKESTTVVPVDRAAFIQEARELTGDPGLTLLAYAEGHAGASAADHANFKVVCRRMIADAGPADLEQVYLIDSRRWPCRVTGVFTNVANLSPEMQDVFLDRVKWLQNSRPLVQSDFREILADRLARLRPGYVSEVLRNCARAAGMSEEHFTTLLPKWALASPGPKYHFALHLVETLREGLIYQKGAAETFSPEIVESHGAAVMKDYKKHLTPYRR